MNNAPKLVYVTHIRTTPAKLWEALTDPDFIQQYFFGCRNTSTWQVGDVIESRDPDGELSWHGKILKSIPGQEVVFTFDHLTDEPPSTVRYEIEPQGEVVKLTITHEDFQEVSAIRDRVKNGWPGIIEGIKSLLEKGFVEVAPSSCKEPA
ncbi:SRPBCC family protein [Luteolibacter yonseiensis]|uniref:SRPBCC family protein n=1 Tax=Luteolibacter yonseiensis TaxID=1144680 RepID=A0A934R3R6_9BACT|nr:SRPBCC family protein [Luteolibacter yonseiensis]MBK1816344.1 SRPBCC family protein [Luteolibacter yonseiensis]